MTTAELLLLDYDAVVRNTRRTLEHVPEDKPAWTPHAKSMPIGRLAMHCAGLPDFGTTIMKEDSLDMGDSKRPRPNFDFTSRAACLEKFEKSAAECRAALAQASDEHLAAAWHFSFHGHAISSNTRAMSFRTMCFDHLIHHTAQLGVYLRLNDIHVPGLYGPSADEPWSAK